MTISVFTKTQSSAISMIEIEGDRVDIAFQSSPSKVYTFISTPEFIESLQLVINGNIEEVSLGSVVHKAKMNNDLKYALLSERG
jgi:hypothetical protein